MFRHLFLHPHGWIRMQRHLRIMAGIGGSEILALFHGLAKQLPLAHLKTGSSRLAFLDLRLFSNSIRNSIETRWPVWPTGEERGRKGKRRARTCRFAREFFELQAKTFSRILIENANRWRNMFDSSDIGRFRLLLSYAFARPVFTTRLFERVCR